MKKTLFFLIATFSVLNAWNIGTVTKVTDGDTIYIQPQHGHSFKARLIGLDTFENKMNHRVFLQLATLKDIHPKDKHSVKEVLKIGHKTARWVTKRVLGKKVEYHNYGLDQYGRTLTYVKNLNYLLIRYGMAIQYPTNLLSKERKKFLLDASREANKEHRGIYEKVK